MCGDELACQFSRAVLFGWRAEIFFQRDFKVHQLVAFDVMHSTQVEVRSGERSGNARNIEEHKSRLSRMRLNRARSKARVLYLILRLAVHRALDLGPRVRKRNR